MPVSNYVSVDFLRDSLPERPADIGWSDDLPTLFIWEGVTNYLTEEAVTRVLTWVGGTAPASRIVFTYVHAGLLDGSVRFSGGDRILENVRALKAPWTFGSYPQTVAAYLAGCGLTLVEDVGADEYRARYLPGIGEPPGYSFYRIAVGLRDAASL